MNWRGTVARLVLRLWRPQSFIVSDGTYRARRKEKRDGRTHGPNGLIQGKTWEKTYGDLALNHQMVIYMMTKYDSQWNDSREKRNWKAWGLSIRHQFWEK